MVQMSHLTLFCSSAIFMACMIENVLAAPGSEQAPAGQMCSKGSYVIGFDSGSNIICSGACGNGVLNPAGTCDEGNTENGDSSPAKSQPEEVEQGGAAKVITVQAIVVDTEITPSVSSPVISKIKPSKVVFGKRELDIRISGTGFHSESVVLFDGKTFTPSVNQAGTRLEVTIPTRDLNIGPYVITVSNGPGMDDTVKRGLEVY